MVALLGSWALVFVMNVAPALMPPTWTVLAALHLVFGIPAAPLAIGGAVSASAGRLVLALLSRRYARPLLSPRRRGELSALGRWLDRRGRWAAPLAVLVYSFGPIPSNQLFVAAGLTGMSLRPIVGAFLAGRLVSYPVWIGAASYASGRLDDLFERELTDPGVLALQLAVLALLVAFTRVDWVSLIERFDPCFAELPPGVGRTAHPGSGESPTRASSAPPVAAPQRR